MTLSAIQAILIIATGVVGTTLTRFLPFILFRKAKADHPYIAYLGSVLPYAAIGMLVVYCLRNVRIDGPTRGIPETLAIISIVVLHYWKENTLLSIGAGTAVYMILVQTIFV